MMKRIATTLVLVAMGCYMAGCNNKITREEVVQSSYYQELEKKYEKKQKRIAQLKEQLEEAKANTQGNNEAIEFLKQVEQGYYVKLQVNDQRGKSCFVDYQPIFEYVTEWISRAQCLQRYTREETIQGLTPTYEYYLYDEDNSTYMMQVYENDYVCFQERPNDVYVIYGANDMGDAFLASEEAEYTDVWNQMKYATLAIKGDKAYDQKDSIRAFATILEGANKKKTSPITKEANSQYLFFYHGQVIQVDFYDTCVAIVGDAEENWYALDQEIMTALKECFRKKR